MKWIYGKFLYIYLVREGVRSKLYTSKIKNCVHVKVAISGARKVRAELLELVSRKLQHADYSKNCQLHVMNISQPVPPSQSHPPLHWSYEIYLICSLCYPLSDVTAELTVPDCSDRIDGNFSWIQTKKFQHATAHYSILQHTTAYYNTLQHTTAHNSILQHTTSYYSILQHTTAYYNTLQHTTAYYNTLQHTTAYYITLQYTTTYYSILQHTTTHYSILQHIATHYSILQHTTTHYNTQQQITTR
jgi:hypothetical protein